ncbi:MAG: CDP-alcohol phosphatidyltransferase family protein [Rhodospirillales bacterium]|nr:CDP-alcohol phosphatidyltransferase family protein [Rhodospirillales bacterium]
MFVRPIANTAVTPNQLTFVRLITGVGAAVLLGIGATPWEHIGAGVFVVSVLLDRADGELARMTGKMSRGGHILDLWADALCNVLILVGLGVGLRDSSYGVWAAPMGILAGAAVSVILWTTIRMENLEGRRAAELGTLAGFDPDDAILAIPLFIWLGYSEGLLLAAAVCTPLAALLFVLRFRRKLFRVTPS